MTHGWSAPISAWKNISELSRWYLSLAVGSVAGKAKQGWMLR